MQKNYLTFIKFFVATISFFCVTCLHGAPLNNNTVSPASSKSQPILIAGAMDIEIDTLIKSIKHPKQHTICQYQYISGTYKDYPVVVAKTEQGTINAAISTTLAIEQFNPIIILNIGTAGGYTTDLHTNDIVIAQKSFNSLTQITRHANKGQGANINGEPLRGVFTFDKPSSSFKLKLFHEADPQLLKIAKKLSTNNPQQRITFGAVATSDSWNNQIDRMNYLHQQYGAVAEEMETDAIAQVACVYDIPFIGMRVISNSAIHQEPFNPNSAQIIQQFTLRFIQEFINLQKNFK